VKVSRLAVSSGTSGLDLGERVGNGMRVEKFLEDLRAAGLDVASVKSVEAPQVTAEIMFSVPRGAVPQAQVAEMGQAGAAGGAAARAGAGAYATARAAGASATEATGSSDTALGQFLAPAVGAAA